MSVTQFHPVHVVRFDAHDRAIVASDLDGRELVCLSPAGHLQVGDHVEVAQDLLGRPVCVLEGDWRLPKPRGGTQS